MIQKLMAQTLKSWLSYREITYDDRHIVDCYLYRYRYRG